MLYENYIWILFTTLSLSHTHLSYKSSPTEKQSKTNSQDNDNKFTYMITYHACTDSNLLPLKSEHKYRMTESILCTKLQKKNHVNS